MPKGGDNGSHVACLGGWAVLYSDPNVLAKYPWFKVMVDVFSNATARPSTFASADSNQPSTAFFQNVNKLLTGVSSFRVTSQHTTY